MRIHRSHMSLSKLHFMMCGVCLEGCLCNALTMLEVDFMMFNACLEGCLFDVLTMLEVNFMVCSVRVASCLFDLPLMLNHIFHVVFMHILRHIRWNMRWTQLTQLSNLHEPLLNRLLVIWYAHDSVTAMHLWYIRRECWIILHSAAMGDVINVVQRYPFCTNVHVRPQMKVGIGRSIKGVEMRVRFALVQQLRIMAGRL